MQKAIIIGSTGLVGKEVLRASLSDPYFSSVTIFVRRPTGISHPKLTEEIVDFNNMEDWRALINGDVLFSAMGTTLKKAGSKDAQYKVDYTYQYRVAEAASENGVPDYVLVSAPGASAGSMIFYSRIKGELDRDVKKLKFRRIILIKPSILEGDRDEERSGEKLGIKFANLFKDVPFLKKYRPVHGKTVASAMINAVKSDKDDRVQEYVLDELFELSEYTD